MIGKVFGNRYRVLREVGSGGMAQVYLAEDKNEKKLVALKVLYPQFGEDLSYVQRFKREAKLANSLNNPHIVRVLDYGADRDMYYLVMEYISGRDVRDVLDERGPFSWREALETIDQLCSALQHASEHGVVHRDIKPQNLMIDESGLLKVLDFGIARIDALPSLTQSGFVGSPYYVSPEQAMGEEVDIRSDIYSSGIVLYELLSGNIPFDAKSPWSVISKHISSEPPPIDFKEDDVPREVQELLSHMIAKKAHNRFQNPTILHQAIAAVLAGQSFAYLMPDSEAINKAPADPVAIIDSYYQRATQAMNIGQWSRAAGLFQELLQLDPEHTAAAEKLKQSQQEAELMTQYIAAKQAMKNGFWEDALNRLNKIMAIQPTYQNVVELQAQAKQGAEKAKTERPVTNEPPPAPIDNTPVVTMAVPATSSRPRFLLLAGNAIFLAIIITGAWLWFNRSQPMPPSDLQEPLKALYQEAQQALKAGKEQDALKVLQQISQADPNYADVAALIREISSTPTPVPTEVIVQTTVENPLVNLLQQAQNAVDQSQWVEAITQLQELRMQDARYEEGRVASLFCDAYVGRGLDTLNNLAIDVTTHLVMMTTALNDFEAGAKECPRRTDLRDQTNRASAYLKSLSAASTDYDSLIQDLNPIVAAEPNYANGGAKQLLYKAYLARGDSWRDQKEQVKALGDYQAAIDLNVPDPLEARSRQAEVLIGGQKPTDTPQPPPTDTPRPGSTATTPARIKPTVAAVLPTPITLKEPPELITANDSSFSGRLTEVYLEWKPTELAEDEYYNLTITYIFGQEIKYWGTATRETKTRIPVDIGVGQAGNDRFSWWVTIRKKNSAPTGGGTDLATSKDSEVRSFVWTGS